MRAYATVGQGEESRCQIVDVPIRFLQAGSTADEVRDSVLDLVESVETLSEEEIPSSSEIVLAATSEATETTPSKKTTDDDKVPDENIDDKVKAICQARKQPKSPEEEAILAARYAAISNVGERAFCILKDLGMI